VNFILGLHTYYVVAFEKKLQTYSDCILVAFAKKRYTHSGCTLVAFEKKILPKLMLSRKRSIIPAGPLQ
jgi:hypothetical protein